ncbi:MAG: glycosyltransferase family 39 protein [Candidatus Promineofilum sp.]|nr:glycosyltransferase family 39 protein [Promineifilum sp.]
MDNLPTPLGSSPPGLEHDEVAHWLINQDILAGNHAIYFTEAYGHEALYHYLQAGFGALVGDHALALRLPSAYFGVLLVAVSYALGRRMFGVRVGLWSAAFLAVLFWPVFYSRLALRAISLPVFSGLAAYWWWRAFVAEQKHPGARESDRSSRLSRSFALPLLSGLFAGLSLYTYMAARAVPIFFALYTLYLFLFHRPTFRRQGRGLALFWLVMILVAAPLVAFLLTNPGAEIRIAEVDAPLRALRDGEMRPVLENGLKITGMFGVSGDPLWRQNIAGRPVFDPIMGLLFYAGVLLSLSRWRDRRYAFLLLWLAASIIPSLVTIDAPSSIRVINLLPVLMLFPLVVIHNTPYLSTVWEKLSTNLATGMVTWGLGLLWLYTAWGTYTGIWRIWPAESEVRFVWQAALTEAAAYLDHSADAGAVAIGGWTPETMDPPTMELTLRRDDLSLRFFDPTQSLILPTALDGQSIRIVIPSALPLFPPLRALVAPWELVQGEFTRYTVPADLAIVPERAADSDFGGQLRFVGYDVIDACKVGGPCSLLTYWEVLAPADGARRLFLHAVDGAGQTVSQDDRLGAPAVHWQLGDIIIQLLSVAESTAELRLGVYDPVSGRRLLTTNDADHVVISGQ